jgi:hypothetical protein
MRKKMKRTLQGLFSLAVLAVLLTSCAQPTPDAEAVARALVSIWATQTAEAPTLQPTFAVAEEPAPTATIEPTPASPETTATATREVEPTVPQATATSAVTSAATLPATRTVAATPPSDCAIATDAELTAAWDAARLGCPTAPAATTWAAWQPFERGALFWRSDLDWTYALHYSNGTDSHSGDWQTGEDAWRWDDSFPEGRDLTLPPGRFEPIRGFGYVWNNFLDGPQSELGWGTDEEKGVCVTLQPFENGLIFKTNRIQFCENQFYNRATDPGFAPLFFNLHEDGSWQRH